VVIGTDCVGSCKSDYHSIMTTSVGRMAESDKTLVSITFFIKKNNDVESFCWWFDIVLILYGIVEHQFKKEKKKKRTLK